MTALHIVADDAQLPAHVGAERTLLDACISLPSAFVDARPHLLDTDFYQPRHETVWETICALADTGRAPTEMLVMTEPRNLGASRSNRRR